MAQLGLKKKNPQTGEVIRVVYLAPKLARKLADKKPKEFELLEEVEATEEVIVHQPKKKDAPPAATKEGPAEQPVKEQPKEENAKPEAEKEKKAAPSKTGKKPTKRKKATKK